MLHLIKLRTKLFLSECGIATFTVAFDKAQDKELFLSEGGMATFTVAFDKARNRELFSSESGVTQWHYR